MGKKIILTDKLRKEILDLMDEGYSVRSIFTKTGINNTIYYRWINEDETFCEQCQGARRNSLKRLKMDAEDCIASKVEKNESDSWKAGAWFLSHRHPSEYAERRIQDNSHDLASPFDKLFEALAKKDDITETEKK